MSKLPNNQLREARSKIFCAVNALPSSKVLSSKARRNLVRTGKAKYRFEEGMILLKDKEVEKLPILSKEKWIAENEKDILALFKEDLKNEDFDLTKASTKLYEEYRDTQLFKLNSLRLDFLELELKLNTDENG